MKVNVVRGNIGSGKSSLLHAIEACTQYESDTLVFLEDTRDWAFYLEKFYASPREYVFRFQKQVECHFFQLTKRLEQLEEQSVVYVERSPLDVLHVFLPLNRQLMTPKEYSALSDSMECFANLKVWREAVYYNVECPAEVCMERIGLRKRDGEEHITLDYVTRLHTLYEQLYSISPGIPLRNHGSPHSLFESVQSLRANAEGQN